MANELTDGAFWTSYWESKINIAFSIPKNYLFHEIFKRISDAKGIESAIELGGFPGYYTVFLKKHLGIKKTTLLDYFIHPGLIKQLCQANALSPSDIEIIETNLLAYTPTNSYDLVLSCGLIEHFKDTRDILARHVQFMKAGSSLVITLPNFRGINGWVQKTFDKENYDKHELACMDPQLLRSLLEELGLIVEEAGYYGKFSVWLEEKESQSAVAKVFVKGIWVLGKVWSKLFPFESKNLSPYILVVAGKR
ncbi:MAG: class I SAM-dependent methyltransferase [Sphingobacteriaceae bacterium]|nr:class I SAM-dependent methyltransferase [Sphingobacteriaceae bacterium]